MHTDPVQTQVVTAILNVGQENDNGGDGKLSTYSAWPLRMCRASDDVAAGDEDGWVCEEVHGMAPGDFVLLESARLFHGRPQRLEGPTTKYANAFWHWAIADQGAWDYRAWL